ncbi:hypothetical protein DICPUDRAFT_55192 [Dictyostelium purpureum]|uniref:NADH dehydrogenase [ubiquinone] iron-sulfur protein 4, mitochondrial n=1 Tax=Dictyostelium purpureum TaxID=5786 RepID=F0ZKT0_DICPU|nr:uncharacterized protein DICPUDRAFT_55192 [Dictyostelium purpureum]EGC35481.1 hypothetical protein DICPUDRAFT_55192 [Dictyostelium purpureum]|eukprot:XP_003288024.1 hypothetical protein DICPUDRAFT_55192 [Dictyostelium purpureum]
MFRYLLKPTVQNRIVSARRFSTATPIVSNEDLTVGTHKIPDSLKERQIKEFLNGVDFRGQTVIIYKPSRNTMQTGTLATRKWVIGLPFADKWNDRLMGWCSSKDSLNQLNLKFSSEADAVAYCKEIGLDYTIVGGEEQIKKKKKYGYRFRYRGDLEGQELNEESIN